MLLSSCLTMCLQIPKGEREKRAKFNSDFCTFEQRHFIRCVLALPLAGGEAYFGYGAWAEVDRATFERYLELSFRGGSPVPPGHGTIANRFGSYPEAYGSPVSILFGPKERPMLVAVAPESELSLEQANGKSAERCHRILVDERMI
jgi:hypothetical protein